LPEIHAAVRSVLPWLKVEDGALRISLEYTETGSDRTWRARGQTALLRMGVFLDDDSLGECDAALLGSALERAEDVAKEAERAGKAAERAERERRLARRTVRQAAQEATEALPDDIAAIFGRHLRISSGWEAERVDHVHNKAIRKRARRRARFERAASHGAARRAAQHRSRCAGQRLEGLNRMRSRREKRECERA